ncbi:hypothetical protein CEQ08_14045 [Providencia rettgeri]|nr:hypothetical protein CEQ08_14045 [Providencia rettgeri]
MGSLVFIVLQNIAFIRHISSRLYVNLRSFALVTYLCKLLATHSLVALMRLELFRIKVHFE